MTEFGRRTFLLYLFGGLLGSFLWPRRLLAQETAGTKETAQPCNFRWRVTATHFETVEAKLRSKEAKFEGKVEAEKDTKGLAVFIFVGAVLVPYLVDAVLALRRDIVHGGVVIDTRGSEIVIDNDPRLDGGTLVLVTSEGVEIYERHDIVDPTELVSALIRR